GIADGFWASLQPLAPCKHELRFSRATPGNSFVVSHIMIIVTHLQSINKTVGNGLLEMSSTSSPSYRCEVCGRSFDWLQELEQHKRQEHQK
ncbi:MAG: C2H2-type zinc finger protein, partial [Candidatus Nitrosopolaris sp.]